VNLLVLEQDEVYDSSNFLVAYSPLLTVFKNFRTLSVGDIRLIKLRVEYKLITTSVHNTLQMNRISPSYDHTMDGYHQRRKFDCIPLNPTRKAGRFHRPRDNPTPG